MNTDQIWSWVSHICSAANQLITDKTGYQINLPAKCLQTKEFAIEHLTVILIVSGVLLLLSLITVVLRKLNQKIKSFQATLLHAKEVTHDTRIFTFDLPKGWNNIGLKIG